MITAAREVVSGKMSKSSINFITHRALGGQASYRAERVESKEGVERIEEASMGQYRQKSFLKYSRTKSPQKIHKHLTDSIVHRQVRVRVQILKKRVRGELDLAGAVGALELGEVAVPGGAETQNRETETDRHRTIERTSE